MLISRAVEHRDARIARIARIVPRTPAEAEDGPARVGDQSLMEAAVAEPVAGGGHSVKLPPHSSIRSGG